MGKGKVEGRTTFTAVCTILLEAKRFVVNNEQVPDSAKRKKNDSSG